MQQTKTKKTIYISGPITDVMTGQPRDGWKKGFLRAEDLLHRMGYNAINPTEIARQTEDEWREMLQLHPYEMTRGLHADVPTLGDIPTRATYVLACLQTMNTEALAGRLDGVLLIGDKQEIYYSHDVQAELHMAAMLNIPVFYDYYRCNEIDLHLLPIRDGRRLVQGGVFGNEDWSDKL